MRLSATEHVTGNGTTCSYFVFSALFSSATVTIPSLGGRVLNRDNDRVTVDGRSTDGFNVRVHRAHTDGVPTRADVEPPVSSETWTPRLDPPSSHLLQQVSFPAAFQPHVSVHHVDAIRMMPVGCAKRVHRSPIAVFRRDNIHVTGLLVPGRDPALITDNDNVPVVATTRGLSSAHVPTVPYFFVRVLLE